MWIGFTHITSLKGADRGLKRVAQNTLDGDVEGKSLCRFLKFMWMPKIWIFLAKNKTSDVQNKFMWMACSSQGGGPSQPPLVGGRRTHAF